LTAHYHRTGSAPCFATSVFRAGQVKAIAQDTQQTYAGINIDRPLCSIYVERGYSSYKLNLSLLFVGKGLIGKADYNAVVAVAKGMKNDPLNHTKQHENQISRRNALVLFSVISGSVSCLLSKHSA
jgi:hypothetical protein